MSEKVRAATVWLDGCSGCHMSFLDLDERLLELAEHVDFVYTPLVDVKEYPEGVDIALIEGAVSSEEDLHKIQKIRKRTKILISFGNCAVAGNVPMMRNRLTVDEVMSQTYIDTIDVQPQIPNEVVPALLHPVRPVHAVVPVDIFMQGCPPSADVIYYTITELLAGREPDLTDKTRRGK